MITIYYTCLGCQARKVPVAVPQRGPKEDIANWMETLKQACRLSHFQISPACQSEKIDVAIPFADNKRIGDDAPDSDGSVLDEARKP